MKKIILFLLLLSAMFCLYCRNIGDKYGDNDFYPINQRVCIIMNGCGIKYGEVLSEKIYDKDTNKSYYLVGYIDNNDNYREEQLPSEFIRSQYYPFN